MKVLFLTYSPSPYRMDFFNEMGKYCDLIVTFENESTSNRNKSWFNRTASSFKPIFLHGKKLKNGNTFSPAITKVIQKGYDRIIVSNYSTPTSMYAIEYLRFHHIPFWLEADGGMIANEDKLKYLVKKHFISSASHWFSSGKVTSEYFVHYGANPEEIYVYPFTSLRESDILKEVPSEEEKMEIRRKLGIGGVR